MKPQPAAVAVVTLIRTYLTHRGSGEPTDPCRIVTQYWDMEGNLVFEINPVENERAIRAAAGNLQ